MPTPFAVKPVISESGDATIVIITDGSNYDSGNTDGITSASVTSRVVVVSDYLGNVIATLTLTLQPDGSYAAQLPVTADNYYEYVLTVSFNTGSPQTGQTNYVQVQHYNNAFIAIMQNQQGDCGCCDDGNICTNLTWAMHNKNAAIIFASKAMGQLSQQSITAANQFLSAITTG